MRELWEGRKPPLHGVRMGVAAVLVHRAYELVLAHPVWEEGTPFDLAAVGMGNPVGERLPEREALLREWFGPVAARVIEAQRAWRRGDGPAGKRSPGPGGRVRAAELTRHQIEGAVRPHLLSTETLRRWLRSAGSPATAADLGLGRAELEISLLAAKEIRPRRTILHLADELGILPWLAATLAAEEPA